MVVEMGLAIGVMEGDNGCLVVSCRSRASWLREKSTIVLLGEEARAK